MGETAHAADPRIKTTISDADLAVEQRTKTKLYLSAREAAALLAVHNDMVLIDVRDPVTVAQVGLAAETRRNIPFYFRYVHLRGSVDEIELWEPNQRFAADVRHLVAERQSQASMTVIVMCWKGTYSARAAEALAEAGLENVYTVIDGTDGDMRGGAFLRRYPGWRALGRRWLDKPRPSQRYAPPE